MFRTSKYLIYIGCLGAWLGCAAAQSGGADARSVQVITAERGTLTATRVTSVLIAPARESRIAASTSGRVLHVRKRENMTVAAGEPVVVLDTQTLEGEARDARLEVERARIALQSAQETNQGEQTLASSGLRSAEAALKVARQKFEEAEQLYAEGFISLAERNQLEADFTAAQSAYAQAQDALRRSNRAGGEDLELLRLTLRQAENRLAQLQTALDGATVRAPFAGEVAELLIEEGETVIESEPVFRLISTESQVARFNVPLDIAQQLSEQGVVYIQYSGRDYAAQIVSQSAVNPETQLTELTAQLQDSSTRIPNGIVTQLPYTYALAQGVILPSDVPQSEAGQRFVFTAVNGEAVRQEIDILAQTDGRAAVRGLQDGAQIIHPVPTGLLEGSRVTVEQP